MTAVPWYRVLRLLPPERAHATALRLARFAPPAGVPLDPRLRTQIAGLDLLHPVGLAAGFDKNAVALHGLAHLGFAMLEIGTVTPRPQAGNPRPRVWRVPEQGGVVNAMGFPSAGAAAVRNRLLPLRPPGIVGVNIGKNADTPLERASDDYVALVEALFEVAQYITVNVSSPNTVGLRALQVADQLTAMLTDLQAANARMASVLRRRPRCC